MYISLTSNDHSMYLLCTDKTVSKKKTKNYKTNKKTICNWHNMKTKRIIDSFK